MDLISQWNLSQSSQSLEITWFTDMTVDKAILEYITGVFFFTSGRSTEHQSADAADECFQIYSLADQFRKIITDSH